MSTTSTEAALVAGYARALLAAAVAFHHDDQPRATAALRGLRRPDLQIGAVTALEAALAALTAAHGEQQEDVTFDRVAGWFAEVMPEYVAEMPQLNGTRGDVR